MKILGDHRNIKRSKKIKRSQKTFKKLQKHNKVTETLKDHSDRLTVCFIFITSKYYCI